MSGVEMSDGRLLLAEWGFGRAGGDSISNGLTLGLILLVTGLILAVPHSTRRARNAGGILVTAGIASILYALPRVGPWFEVLVFWGLALLTVGGSAAAISMRSPVYAAIWFAVSLLGTAGMLVQHHAQFVGVATMVVYAGAIVVTFLFVVMLAQPEGHELHDRLSWGRLAKAAAILAGGLLMALLVSACSAVLSGDIPRSGDGKDLLDDSSELARLGNELFSVHLLAVELAGTLLLVALVGAIALMIHGRERRATQEVPHA
jgi:NADH-quinone oxidoreductase subunit J